MTFSTFDQAVFLLLMTTEACEKVTPVLLAMAEIHTAELSLDSGPDAYIGYLSQQANSESKI